MRKSNPTFLVISLTALLVVGFILRPILASGFLAVSSPISSPLSRVAQSMRRSFSFWSNISSLRRQNEDLGQKITKLEVDRSQIAELQYENDLLKKELGFVEQHHEEDLIPARITGREAVSFIDTIVVDKGAEDGVRASMAVVSEGTLVGQVSEVHEKQSRITLITSRNSVVQAMLQNSRSKGVLRGGLSGLVLENITQDAEISPGEYVVTSGLGGEIKEGMLIGKVNKTVSASSSIFKSVSVDPITDLTKLEIIFIVKGQDY